MEKQSGLSIKILRSDKGGELLNHDFSKYCDEHGIGREFTAPYTPQQNGVVERKNITVMEMARSLLKSKDLPNLFWAEAIVTSVYLINISPTSALAGMTPY